MHILLIDDDERLRERLARALRDRGHTVETAENSREALQEREVPPSHAVIDLRLADESGLTVLKGLLERYPELHAIMLTGYGSIATAVEAVRLGAVNYLQKPADADMVVAALVKGPQEVSSDYEPPTLARAEWEHIQRVLEDCGGNISQAARKLGLHRRTLQRKLSKFQTKN